MVEQEVSQVFAHFVQLHEALSYSLDLISINFQGHQHNVIAKKGVELRSIQLDPCTILSNTTLLALPILDLI
jgi:hypothetical protein